MDKKPLISKWLTVGIILLFVGICILPATAQNTEKTYPASKGTWLYVGGSGPGNYTRIQDAIDNASDGDTIFVYDDSSPYYENVMVNKSINLFGENRETTIIDANGWGSPINLNTSFINISGFTVQNSGENQMDSGIVRDYYSSPFPRACDNITITGNKIINNNYGIYLSHSNNNSINYNIVTQNKMCGIDCAEGRSSNIKNNLITKNRGGINLYISYLFEITQNNLNDNNVGIRLWLSNFNYISENSILNSSDTGIVFFASYNNRIQANNFINNTNDASFEYAFFSALIGNRFTKNYWDSSTGVGPKTIRGVYNMVMVAVAIMFLFNTGGVSEIYIKWFDFDWFPAHKPYDIPGMR